MNENKKKIAFIINPISGTQSKEQILKWLDEKLDKERYAQEVIYTERAGHAVDSSLTGTYKNRFGHHSLRFRQRTCPPSADSDGAEKGHRHHQ